MAGFFGHDRDELDSRSARADDANSLASKVDLFLRPVGRVKRFAFEAVDAFKWGRILRRQDANRPDEKLCPCSLAALEYDFPTMLALVVHCRAHAGIELDVLA